MIDLQALQIFIAAEIRQFYFRPAICRVKHNMLNPPRQPYCLRRQIATPVEYHRTPRQKMRNGITFQKERRCRHNVCFFQLSFKHLQTAQIKCLNLFKRHMVKMNVISARQTGKLHRILRLKLSFHVHITTNQMGHICIPPHISAARNLSDMGRLVQIRHVNPFLFRPVLSRFRQIKTDSAAFVISGGILYFYCKPHCRHKPGIDPGFDILGTLPARQSKNLPAQHTVISLITFRCFQKSDFFEFH